MSSEADFGDSEGSEELCRVDASEDLKHAPPGSDAHVRVYWVECGADETGTGRAMRDFRIMFRLG